MSTKKISIAIGHIVNNVNVLEVYRSLKGVTGDVSVSIRENLKRLYAKVSLFEETKAGIFTDLGFVAGEDGTVTVQKDDARYPDLTARLTEASNKIVTVKLDQYPTSIVNNTIITPDEIDALVFLELLLDDVVEDEDEEEDVAPVVIEEDEEEDVAPVSE